MLFSNKEIADYINSHFEPTWKSLRPVPKVTVDFGNGTVVKRTLNGNIATFVCTADGTIIDVVAGIYEPADYLRMLQQAAGHRSSTMIAPTGLLADDSRYNDGNRRRIIHEKLAQMPGAKPEDIMHWLYRDVLHADLDDPMLGLKNVLYSTYPFKDDLVQLADKNPEGR